MHYSFPGKFKEANKRMKQIYQSKVLLDLNIKFGSEFPDSQDKKENRMSIHISQYQKENAYRTLFLDS